MYLILNKSTLSGYYCIDGKLSTNNKFNAKDFITEILNFDPLPLWNKYIKNELSNKDFKQCFKKYNELIINLITTVNDKYLSNYIKLYRITNIVNNLYNKTNRHNFTNKHSDTFYNDCINSLISIKESDLYSKEFKVSGINILKACENRHHNVLELLLYHIHHELKKANTFRYDSEKAIFELKDVFELFGYYFNDKTVDNDYIETCIEETIMLSEFNGSVYCGSGNFLHFSKKRIIETNEIKFNDLVKKIFGYNNYSPYSKDEKELKKLVDIMKFFIKAISSANYMKYNFFRKRYFSENIKPFSKDDYEDIYAKNTPYLYCNISQSIEYLKEDFAESLNRIIYQYKTNYILIHFNNIEALIHFLIWKLKIQKTNFNKCDCCGRYIVRKGNASKKICTSCKKIEENFDLVLNRLKRNKNTAKNHIENTKLLDGELHSKAVRLKLKRKENTIRLSEKDEMMEFLDKFDCSVREKFMYMKKHAVENIIKINILNLLNIAYNYKSNYRLGVWTSITTTICTQFDKFSNLNRISIHFAQDREWFDEYTTNAITIYKNAIKKLNVFIELLDEWTPFEICNSCVDFTYGNGNFKEFLNFENRFQEYFDVRSFEGYNLCKKKAEELHIGLDY